MSISRVLPFQLSVLATAMLLSPVYALEAEPETATGTAQAVPDSLPTIRLVASKQEISSSNTYTVKKSSSAHKLNVSVQETPQTVNVVTRQQMDDFALTSSRAVLSNTPGVTVQATETDRSVYTARGFEISNILVDGVGFPASEWNYNDTDPDSYFYDRIEVVKGADALMNAFGDPSATINYIRKRPSRDLQANAGVSYGSWNTQRYEADVSGAFTADGRVRGRLLGYEQTGDYYLDRYSVEKNGFAVSLAADLTDSTLLTVGYSRDNRKPNAVNWGALPLMDADGKQISYAGSYNPNPDWTYWDNQSQNTFVELQQKINDDWKLNFSYNYDQKDRQSQLLYYSGYPTATGANVDFYASGYLERNSRKSADINLNGAFELFGQKHELVIGATTAQNWQHDHAKNGVLTDSRVGQCERGSGAGMYYSQCTTDWASWTPTSVTFSDFSETAKYKQKIKSIYAATRLHVNDDLKVMLGANYIDASSTGSSYGSPVVFNENKVSPYVGVTYNLAPEYTGYASYTSIFRPQTSVDAATGQAAKPIDGESYEAGLKSAWLDKRLTGTFALFRTTESNYPLRSSDGNPLNHKVDISDLRAQGVEVTVAGQVTDNLNLSLGYVQFNLKDLKNGGEARTYNPNQTFNLLTTYALPMVPGLKLGAGLQWQAEIKRYDADYDAYLRQGDYALLSLMASYEVNDHISVQANGYNVGNKKYLNSFNDGQAFYGAPANYTVGIKFKY